MINNHVNCSKKHSAAKLKMKEKQSREQDIAEAFREYTSASMALLVQPSSAAAERVFSLLKCSFGDHQDSSLQDYIETSLMLQFNAR